MAEAAILTKIKTAVRVNGTAHDAELTDLIEACKIDLAESGVVTVDDTDALTILAITSYCKARFGYDNEEAARFWESYCDVRSKMALAETYNAAGTV